MGLVLEGLREALGFLLRRDPLVLDAALRSLILAGSAVLMAGPPAIALGMFLARRRFVGRDVLSSLIRAGMGMPTVLVGLVGYALFSRRGPLGAFELLYTTSGVVLGEVALAFPIVTSLTFGAVVSLDRRVAETAHTLGAGLTRRVRTYLSEARVGITLALLTAFGRCVTELGVALMIGGNIKYRTRTLATATALETARGEFARGLAMSLLLVLIAAAVMLSVSYLGREEPVE